MLELVVPDTEFFDANLNEFITIRGMSLRLEHSLVSLAQWESKWQQPFLKPRLIMTPAQNVHYIQCMTITQNVNPLIYHHLYREELSSIYQYIEAPMTATTISSISQKSSREIITAEIIYYWMTVFNISFDCQKWHLNRLLTLISVCSLKSAPKKKIPKSELNKRNTTLNAQRLKALGTKG